MINACGVLLFVSAASKNTFSSVTKNFLLERYVVTKRGNDYKRPQTTSNNSETVKETFIRDILAMFAPVSRYWAKLRRGYFRFPDFISTVIMENRHNSRTSNDIDMKLG